MPLQQIDLLLDQRPALIMPYDDLFYGLFSRLPQQVSALFINNLVSTLDVVRATLPPALSSPLPENIAVSYLFHHLLTDLTHMLTIMLSTMITAIKLFVQPSGHSRVVSKLLTAMNTGLYGNPSLDLPVLLNSLQSNITNFPSFTSQPYSALTNLPYELFSILNSQPSVLHRLPFELDNHLYDMVWVMIDDVTVTLEYIHEELGNDVNDSPDRKDYYHEGLTFPYVYQAREDTDTDPENCSICLVEMKDGDTARRLCCLHSFHLECIDRCLKTKRSCPLCRTPIDATLD